MRVEPLTPALGVTVIADSTGADTVPGREEILRLVGEHGLAVFRGFPLDLDGFCRLSAQISPGAQRGVGDDDQGLALHGEGYYLPHRIDLLWFYCISPPETGGATTFCDGVAVVESLNPATVEYFENNPLVFELHLERPLWAPRVGDIAVEEAAEKLQNEVFRPIVETFGEGCSTHCSPGSVDVIDAEFRRKALVPTRWGNRRAFVNTLLHALDPWASSLNSQRYRLLTQVPREILSEVERVTEDLTEEYYWSRDEFAVVDNSRLMHGRRAFTGPREIRAINGVMPD